jgi:hypothetical protein
MTVLATYRTAGGATVKVTVRTNAFGQTVWGFECFGCDVLRGFNADETAYAHAAKHAGRCTDQPQGGSR